jgi:hypothetical protein
LREALAAGDAQYWQRRKELSALKPKPDFYEQAVISLHLGNTNGALDLLERVPKAQAVLGSGGDLNYLLFDEYWDTLHRNRQFKGLLNKIGFTKVAPGVKD